MNTSDLIKALNRRVDLASEYDSLETLDLMERAITALSELMWKFQPYADVSEVSSMSWNGFHLIGDKKSIDELMRLENRSSQIDIYFKAYEERMLALKKELHNERARNQGTA